LRLRSEELNRANVFLNSILTGMRDGVIVVDRDLTVLIWSVRAEDLWGLRADEVVGQPFLNLDIGLSVDQLKHPMRSILNGERANRQSLHLRATNRRGKPIECVIQCTPLQGTNGEPGGVILLMEERPNESSR
jgi:two-component system CheB/CheR fusion protein